MQLNSDNAPIDLSRYDADPIRSGLLGAAEDAAAIAQLLASLPDVDTLLADVVDAEIPQFADELGDFDFSPVGETHPSGGRSPNS